MPTPIAATGRVGAPRPLDAGKDKFTHALQGGGPARPSPPPRPSGPPPVQVASLEQGRLVAAPGKSAVVVARPVSRATVPAPRKTSAVVKAGTAQKTDQVLGEVRQAQARLEHVLRLAQSGKTFTPAELLALQARVSQASQELDLAGKVVDKGTGGVKQLLSTQV